MKKLIATSLVLGIFSMVGFVGCGEETKPAAAPAAGAAGAPATPPAGGGDAAKPETPKAP
jgi:hypothetical protein